MMFTKKIRPRTTLFALVLGATLALSFTPTALADSSRVDLTPLVASLDARPTININFGPAMMAGFSESLRKSNPDLADMLQAVAGLRLMVFENVDSSLAEPQFASLIDQLDQAGWTPAIKINDDDTLIDLYLDESGQLVRGLVLLIRDGADTLILANIHGELNAASIGKLIGSGKVMGGVDLSGLMDQYQANRDGD